MSSMKHIKLFEKFEEFKKPTMFQKTLKGAKRFFNIEDKQDRQTIEKIYRMIDSGLGFVKGVVETQPGVYIIYLNNGNVTLDDNNRTISYNGKELQLKDIDDECLDLYNKIEDLIEKKPSPKYDIVKNTNRTRDIDPYEGLPPYRQEDF